MKYVRYNGGTESYYGCSNPNTLIKGRVYEVRAIYDRGFQTDYTLKGVDGYFNSSWFDELKATYFAYSPMLPTKGQKYCCKRLTGVHGGHSEDCLTSFVESVELIGINTYKVETENSVYVVKIVKNV